MCRDRIPRPQFQNTPPEHDRRAGLDSAYCGLQLEPLQSVRVCTDNSIHVLCDQCCVPFAAKRIFLLCRLQKKCFIFVFLFILILLSFFLSLFCFVSVFVFRLFVLVFVVAVLFCLLLFFCLFVSF